MKIKEIEKLVYLLEKSGILEIEVTDFWGRKVRISKSSSQTVTHQVQKASVSVEKKKELLEEPQEQKKNLVTIRSPIVGTFYRASSPDSPSYVEVGDVIKPGQVVCIIEAMKLMNEIESDVAGRVLEILVKNEEPVEYNQDLFLIEPLKV
ncbi:MAG: acetyl-CoA carboxylase biotin carboxyl carrier protein [candidate division WOR-3 bacterium]|nr:MAG: acetyl-CoA carboxylase biotin carboxyl carrier protein [candidate division WOR-3 bacterium]